MKVTFCAIFVLALGLSNAFWSNCPGTNVPGPDDVISPNCGVDRCRVERGGEFPVVIFATPIGIHTELRTRITAFIFGIGVNLPVEYPFDDFCNNIQFGNGTVTQCPTVPNVQYKIDMVMPISNLYPTFTNTRVQIEFFDRGVRAACGTIIADII